ncbi:hypothetical protein VTN31DRAFT_3504 [Thermomyces dupontii]|uniref:uncharacterized protein n=1 Tax=Talaromyces thermophilus TaxID=28565 RepID=UPI003743A1BF
MPEASNLASVRVGSSTVQPPSPSSLLKYSSSQISSNWSTRWLISPTYDAYLSRRAQKPRRTNTLALRSTTSCSLSPPSPCSA